MSFPTKVHRHAVLANAQVGDGHQTLLPPGAHLTTGDWDSSNQAFTMSAGSNATCGTASSHSCALLPACSCSVDLSIAGKLVAQTPPSSVSRLNRGCDNAPHGAHRT